LPLLLSSLLYRLSDGAVDRLQKCDKLEYVVVTNTIPTKEEHKDIIGQQVG